MRAPQLTLFKEMVKPSRRKKFVCEDLLPDRYHCSECHEHNEAPLVAVTRVGELGCCCESMAVLRNEGLLANPDLWPNAGPSHAERLRAWIR